MMRLIPKNKKAILPLITGLCLSLYFIAGCNDESPPDTKPVVVTKRVDQAAPTKATPETEKAPTSEKSGAPVAKEAVAPVTEAAALETKESSAPATEKTVAPVIEPKAPEAEKATAPAPEPKAPEAEKAVETAADETAGKTVAETEQVSLKTSLLDDTVPPYDPTGKIDPFAALFTEESSMETSDDTEPKRPLTPLEKIDISQLQLKAVILAESGNRAMVEDVTGKPYILKRGTYVGVNSGTVTKILKDRVVIEEKTKDFLGRVTASTRELKIQKPFGEE